MNHRRCLQFNKESDMNEGYERIIRKTIEFCANEKAIGCVALIGSRSRNDGIADEHSDVDLLIVCDDVERFHARGDWMSAIGETWAQFSEAVPDLGHWERRAVFAGGLDADFVLVDSKTLLENPESLAIARSICGGGMRILLDKRGLEPALEGLRGDSRTAAVPEEGAFMNVVNDFFFHYLWAHKKLARGEYWVSAQSVNGYLNAKLLAMLEWHERATRGIDYQTWYDGRRLERWVDPEILPAIGEQFSRYDPADQRRVMRAKAKLFAELAAKAAAGFGFSLETGSFSKLTAWVDANLSPRG
jgi:aminoglycoside 6-adenylyltransferase